ncbi:MAG TPA: DUF433 domain-containing protein [Methylomirabilota bacterium]|nr:DUF433 domain-containing protein [Methylomirabilota bacterium]
MSKGGTAFEKKTDPRELAAYSIAEVAHYLRMPAATLRYWVLGREHATSTGKGFYKPVITPAEHDPPILSFVNLVEVHVLGAIRRQHKVPLPEVRKALNYVTRHFPSRHPLADQAFVTDGLSLFVEKFGQLINVSREGQLAMREVLEAHLRRIERDPEGAPRRLYLFTRMAKADEPKTVVVDPFISFGRPILVGTSIPTMAVAERYKAGETIESLASDYDCPSIQIEEAIRCEFELRAA